MTRFAIRSGSHEFALPAGVLRIGRAADSEIRLDDESVSRAHAILEIDGERVVLRESGSRNGVRVNGEPRRGAIELSPGDRIQIGASELVLVDRDPGALEGEGPGTRPIARPRASERPPRRTALDRLSRRERDVLERIALGRTQREIAAELGISVKTYETYRARVIEKLGVHTRAELVAFAIRSGLLRASSVPPPRGSRPPPSDPPDPPSDAWQPERA